MPKKDKAPKPLSDNVTVFNAISMGNLKLLKRIVEERGDSLNNVVDKYGDTPLKIAIINQRGDIIRYLVEAGADVNDNNNNYHERPLNLVFYSVNHDSRDDLLKYLIEHGADVNQGDGYGNTILISASGLPENLPLIRYLVEEAGADINHQNNDGVSPLIAACRSIDINNLPVIKYLVEHGADVNTPGPNNKTALNIIEDLLKRSVNPQYYQNIYNYLRSYPIQQRWKKSFPKVKKMVRNRVFLNEVAGFPQNVAKQISEQSVGFGKSRNRSSKLRSVDLDIFYLLK
uniref:Uncharacterized protein n=1 Tax=viral metagenome TaxID=1070528 RepID=A0A6C0B0C8_9ZZZZ